LAIQSLRALHIYLLYFTMNQIVILDLRESDIDESGLSLHTMSRFFCVCVILVMRSSIRAVEQRAPSFPRIYPVLITPWVTP
jgi:hypothetical protein